MTATYTNLQHANYLNRKSKPKWKEQKKTTGPLRHQHRKTKCDHQRHRNQAHDAREEEEERETETKRCLAQGAQAEDKWTDETTDNVSSYHVLDAHHDQQ